MTEIEMTKPAKKRLLLFCKTQTTGLSEADELIAISMLAVDVQTFAVVSTFERHYKPLGELGTFWEEHTPFLPEGHERRVLDHVEVAALVDYIDTVSSYCEGGAVMMVGSNPKFDIDKIMAACKRARYYPPTMHHRSIDISSLGVLLWMMGAVPELGQSALSSLLVGREPNAGYVFDMVSNVRDVFKVLCQVYLTGSAGKLTAKAAP
jgi:hypothetical protein